MARNPNVKLAGMIDRAGCSNTSFALRVQAVADEWRVPMTCDHVTVQRWRNGQQPRGMRPQVIAEAVSRKLGERVSVSDIGMEYAEAPLLGADSGATTMQVSDSIASFGQLVELDLARSSRLQTLQIAPDAWRDLVMGWFIDPDDGPTQSTASGLVPADLEAVRAMTEMFSGFDYQHGGGRPRLPLAQYLSSDVLPKLELASPSSQLGTEYLSAAAALTRLAGWTAYDIGMHGPAQEYLRQALRLAKAANDRALGGRIFAGMSHQANYLGHYQRAVDLARAAHQGHRGQATPTAMALYYAMEARGLASLGRERECRQAMTHAETWFSKSNPVNDPEWLWYFDAAELHAEFAHCYRDLGNPERACHHAEESIKASDSRYVRSLAFCRTVLATGHLLRGELEYAIELGREVVDTAARLRSARVVSYLADFRARISGHGDVQAVREFNDYARIHLPSAEGTPAPGRSIVA